MSETSLLCVCDDKGEVWHSDGGSRARPSGLKPAAFAAGREVQAARQIRVVSTDTELVLSLLDATVAAGSHLLAVAACAAASPQVALQQMWLMMVMGSGLHRWQRVTAADANAYRLSQAVVRLDWPAVGLLLPKHPAWAAMSFIPGFSSLACVEMLEDLPDIRFFLHPERPARLSRLYRFFGLTAPGDSHAMVNGRHGAGPNRRRYRKAATAWLGIDPVPGGCPEQLSAPLPEDFLRRRYNAALRPEIGLLKTTQCYLRFVQLVWLSERSSNELRRFVPEMFFTDPQTSEAFRLHQQQTGSRWLD